VSKFGNRGIWRNKNGAGSHRDIPHCRGCRVRGRYHRLEDLFQIKNRVEDHWTDNRVCHDTSERHTVIFNDGIAVPTRGGHQRVLRGDHGTA